MPDRQEMRTDRGRAGYRSILSWRRTGLTAAAVGCAAVFSLADRNAITEWVPMVLAAVTIAMLLLVAALRGEQLGAGSTELGKAIPLAAVSGAVCLCSAALLLESVLRLIV